MGGFFEVTGWGTIGLAWLLALLTIVVVTRGWARLATSGARSVLARILVQVLVTVMIALAVGVTVNRTGLWFVTWRDLGSAVVGPPGGDFTDHGAPAAAAAGKDLGTWGPSTAAVTPSPVPTTDPHTGMQAHQVTGPASGHTGTVYAWVPPGAAGDRSAIEVFHGYPVSAQSAYANLRLGPHIQDLLANTVVLIPDWSPHELDSECVDGPAAKIETWLTTDVPAWAVKTLGVRADRAAWATFGYSAGGYCAAMTAMRHPQTYAAGISFGGYTRPQFSSHYRPFEPDGSPYDLPLLARTTAPDVALLVQYSEHDALVAPSSSELVAAARPPLSVTRWDTPDAGHRVGAWEPLVPGAFEWLRATAPGFA